jgi:methylenetetrahydrofolate reductase (NADPH)
MRDQVSGMMIPDETVRRLRDAEDPAEEGVRAACELIAQVREIEGVSGVHLMPVMWEKITPRIVEEAAL